MRTHRHTASPTRPATAATGALAIAVLSLCGLAPPAQADALDGRWRGTTSGTPQHGKCRSFSFDFVIRSGSASGEAITPHDGSPVRWTVSGAASGRRIILLVESGDRRLRRPSTRWRGELRGEALHLSQLGSHACQPTRSGILRKH
jgi:hypothetical protein